MFSVDGELPTKTNMARRCDGMYLRLALLSRCLYFPKSNRQRVLGRRCSLKVVPGEMFLESGTRCACGRRSVDKVSFRTTPGAVRYFRVEAPSTRSDANSASEANGTIMNNPHRPLTLIDVKGVERPATAFGRWPPSEALGFPRQSAELGE